MLTIITSLKNVKNQHMLIVYCIESLLYNLLKILILFLIIL